MGFITYIETMFGFVLDLGMVFGPLIGYLAQFVEIYQRKNSEGFSTRVSLILVIANITRVFFWYFRTLILLRFGKRFSLVLLFAAIVMIIGQVFSL